MYLLLVAFLFLTVPHVYAGQSVALLLDPDVSEQPLGQYLDVFEDKNETMDLQDILKTSGDLPWKRSTVVDPNYGLSKSSFWVRLTFDRSRLTKETAYLLEFKYPLIGNIDTYLPDEKGHYQKSSYGINLPFSSRPLSFSRLTLPVSVVPGSLQVYYFRLKSDTFIRAGSTLWATSAFAEEKAKTEMFAGVYYGSEGVLIGLLFFLWLATGNRILIYYCLATLFAILFQSAYNGDAYGFLWPDLPTWNLISIPFFLGTFTALSVLFFREYQQVSTWSKKIDTWLKTAMYCAAAAALAALILPYQYVIIATLIIATFSILLVGVIGFLSLKHSKHKLAARYFIGAFSFFLLGSLVLILHSLGILPTRSLWTQNALQIGSLIEKWVMLIGFGHRLYLDQKEYASKLRSSNDELFRVNTSLESIVLEKIHKMRSILDNVPHGILVINGDLSFAEEFSNYALEIMETPNIYQKSVQDLILDRSSLSSDEKDRLTQSLQACIGEDAINFEVNRENFPSHLEYITLNGSHKILELNWGVNTTEIGLTKQIVLSITDVTASKALQFEMNKNNHRMKLINELLELDPHKFGFFVESFEHLLEEAEQILETITEFPDSLKVMFINLHTGKGEARTLHLEALSNAIHEAEEIVAKALSSKQGFDKTAITEHMREVRTIFNEYKSLHYNDLGRKENSQDVIMKREQLTNLLGLLTCLNKANRGKFRALPEMIGNLEKVVLSELVDIVRDSLIHSERIAKDLGRLAPLVVLNIDPCKVDSIFQLILRKISVHLLRNALDHGIETPEERLAHGKLAQGRIELTGRVHLKHLFLEFADDGRGLAIGELKKSLQKTGHDVRKMTIDEIASSIFDAGISTAKSISQFSGRGVGMSAVRKFIEDAGGKIEIRLKEKISIEPECYRFSFFITLPLHKEPIESELAS